MLKAQLGFILVALCFCQFLFAQEPRIHISGQIIDKETKEPLPYANVIFEDASFGTVSDLNGMFSFNIGSSSVIDSFTISYIGYESQTLTLDALTKGNNTVFLERSNKLLNPVTVSATNDEDLKDIIKNLKKNFIGKMRKTPHIASAHYQETIKEGDNYRVFMESIGYAVYLGENNGNVAPFTKSKFFCDNTRCIYPMNPLDESILKRPNGTVGPREALKFRYFGPLSNNKFNFKLDDKIIENNRGYLLIKYSNKKLSSRISGGFIKVDAENLNVVEVSYQTEGLSRILDRDTKGEVIIRYTYINDEPFVAKVEAFVTEKGLTHQTTYNLLTQKLNKFELTEDEFWSFGTYDLIPFIQYEKMAWDQFNLTPKPDYDKIQADLGEGMTLEEKYEKKSGTWFTEPDKNHIEGLKTAQKKVSELKIFFR